MHHLLVNECRVRQGGMQDFVNAVQHWERKAMAAEDAPEFHAVYVASADPARVLIITQFSDDHRAKRFAATGLLEEFHRTILSSVDSVDTEGGFDLFYAAQEKGPAVVFGEDTAHATHGD